MNVSREELAMLAIRRDGLPPTKTRRAAPTRKEREIQRAILDYLATRKDVVAWRQNSGAMKVGDRFVRFGVKGLPDIIGWLFVPDDRVHHLSGYACAMAIEVKKPGAYPTREQQAFLDKLKADGGIAIVARNVTDVITALGPAPRPASRS